MWPKLHIAVDRAEQRRPIWLRLLIFILLTTLHAACGQTEEEIFLGGRNYQPCFRSIPACAGLTAACTLDERLFARHEFPGSFRFLVEADPDSEIEVRMFLQEQRDAGFDTQIFWNEPGCTDVYAYESAGSNLFAESEDLGYIAKSKIVFEGGEHLIEIISDMQARVLIALMVYEPGTQ